MQIYSSGVIKKAGNYWSGSLGGFFSFTGEPGIYGLSNAHVLVDPDGDHPGAIICLPEEVRVGQLDRWTGLLAGELNYFDAAFFLLDEGVEPFWQLPGGAPCPRGFSGANVNDYVYSVIGGIQTWGTITDPAVNAALDFEGYYFTGLIEIVGVQIPFSVNGDSGNLVLNGNDEIVGLLNGISPDGSRSYAVPFLNNAAGLTGQYGKFPSLQIWPAASVGATQINL